jgi:iron complex transport system ATP-binding protein
VTEIAVSVNGLGYAYTGDKWIIHNLSVDIRRGSAFAILGPNGSGKTTLIHLLLGSLKPKSGIIRVTGQTSFVPQLFQVSFDYSALDMVLMGRARKIGLFSQPSRADEDAALKALDRFGLSDLAGRPFHELSGGERQLTIFARALVAEADIVILDEPTSALDLQNQSRVLNWIDKLSKRDGLTVIFTTHHPHHALAVADTAMLIQGVDNYTSGPSDEVLTEASLSALYGVPMQKLAFHYQGQKVTTLVPVQLTKQP